MRVFVVVFICLGCVCVAQQATEIAEIGAASAIIVRGTMLAITTEPPRAPGEITTTRITLRVDDGIRGASTGETLTIRQWNVSSDEYRVGETLVLFLHAPSDGLGLTSPVGGRAGHRRVEDVSVEFLNGLRTAPKPATARPVPSSSPQRPPRPSRPNGSAR